MLASRTSLTSLDAQLLRYWFNWEGLDAEVIVATIEPNETSLVDCPAAFDDDCAGLVIDVADVGGGVGRPD